MVKCCDGFGFVLVTECLRDRSSKQVRGSRANAVKKASLPLVSYRTSKSRTRSSVPIPTPPGVHEHRPGNRSDLFAPAHRTMRRRANEIVVEAKAAKVIATMAGSDADPYRRNAFNEAPRAALRLALF